jgi:hypothetical protein
MADSFIAQTFVKARSCCFTKCENGVGPYGAVVVNWIWHILPIFHKAKGCIGAGAAILTTISSYILKDAMKPVFLI